MKIIQPEVTIQPEVVMPNWVEAGLQNLTEITKPDVEYDIPETSYLLSREVSERLIGSLKGDWTDYIPGNYCEIDIECIVNDQLKHPWPTNKDGSFIMKTVPSGLHRCSSSCSRCKWPFQDVERGMKAYQDRICAIATFQMAGESQKADLLKQAVFPKRCKPCRKLYSSRRRGRKAAERLELLMKLYNWKVTHWIHTEKVQKQSYPFTDKQIKLDKKIKMKKLSRLYESKQWYSQFTGIQVYEAKIRAPGDIVTGTKPDGGEYRREVKTFELHGHIHACVIHPKNGFVDVKEIRSKYFEGSIYKDKFELNKDDGEERTVVKIIGDYLVGYLRKDIIGNMSWCGPHRYRWNKTGTELPGDHYIREIQVHSEINQK